MSTAARPLLGVHHLVCFAFASPLLVLNIFMFPYPRTPGYDTRTLIARPAIVQTDIDRQSRIDGDGNRRLIFRYHLTPITLSR